MLSGGYWGGSVPRRLKVSAWGLARGGGGGGGGGGAGGGCNRMEGGTVGGGRQSRGNEK